MRHLTIVCSLNSVTSYGLHAIQIVRGLLKRGIQPSIRVIRRRELFGVPIPDDVKACVTRELTDDPFELVLYPHGFKPTPSKHTIYYCAHESTRLPPASVDIFNQCHLVLVPSHWCETVFSANGVNSRIRVVPLGIDPDVFDFRSHHRDRTFIFGAGGRMAHGLTRKGLNEAAFVFSRAFPDRKDVFLRIKCFPDCPISQPDDSRVDICRDVLTTEQMSHWYGTLDAFLSCAKGEGWGLMQHEAMACGRPVIGAAFGGVTEFFNHSNGIVVDHVLRPAERGWAGHWGDPYESDLIDKMRWAVENRDAVREIGIRAHQRAIALTWDNSIDQLVGELETIGALDMHQFGLTSHVRPEAFQAQGTPQLPPPPPRPNIDNGVVSLRRNGDIIILLPLMKKFAEERGEPVKMIVHKDYAPLLEGVSYVEPVVWDGDMENPMAAAQATGAFNAQVFHRGMQPTTLPGNFAKLAWHKLGQKWDRYMPLVLDRRNLSREADTAEKVFSTLKPKLLVNLLGVSSPLAGSEMLLNRLRRDFGDTAEIVDLSKIQLPYIFDLLGLMDRAACLITVDTATLWLAHASNVPNIALVHPMDFRASPPRGNCLLRVRYPDIEHTYDEIARLIQATLAVELIDVPMVQVVSDWNPNGDADIQRHKRALDTWTFLPARKLSFKSDRNSRSLGDPRAMPYVRDMIEAGFQTGNEKILVIMNNDIQCTPELANEIVSGCARAGCWWAFRAEKPLGETDGGCDLFAMTRKWWNIHKHQMPDLLHGYSWWDNIMRRMMIWSGANEGRRLYLHEKHPGIATRALSPGEKYNHRLADEWLRQWDEPK